MSTAKVFWSGNSQSVRLPKRFRFAPGVKEVSIQSDGERIILVPVYPDEWPDEFWRAFGEVPDDFERPETVPVEREDLDS